MRRPGPRSQPPVIRRRRVYGTANASRALQLSQLFEGLLGRKRVNGYRPELAPPPTDSTGGGAHARQALSLSRDGERIAFGWVDTAERACMLRTHALLVERHRERHGDRPFDLERRDYGHLYVAVADLMRKRGLEVTIEDATEPVPSAPETARRLVKPSPPVEERPAEESPTGREAPSKRRMLALVGLLVVLLAVAIFLFAG